jgi:hypothetical protein
VNSDDHSLLPVVSSDRRLGRPASSFRIFFSLRENAASGGGAFRVRRENAHFSLHQEKLLPL